jgi:protease II
VTGGAAAQAPGLWYGAGHVADPDRPEVTRHVVHGRAPGHYHWLREKENPDVRAYLEAENAYTDAVMKPTEAFQAALYQEMLARIRETDEEVPCRRGGFFYYSRTEEGKQYPIYCREAGGLEAPEQVMLDLNQLAEGHPFLALGAAAVSDDGRRLAYTTDVTGFREYTLQVKDLETGALLPDRVEKVSAVAWAAATRRSSTSPRTRPSAPTGCTGTAWGSRWPTCCTRSRTRSSASTWAARAAWPTCS